MWTGIHRPAAGTLRKLALQSLHRELDVSHTQSGIHFARAQLDGVVLCRTLIAAEGADVVDIQFLGLPGRQPLGDLLGKAVRIGGGSKSFTRQNSRGLMIAMTVAVGAAKARDDHVWTKGADYAHHVGQRDIVTLPFLKSLVGSLGESKVCDASEALREEFARRYPDAHVTGEFAEMISSDIEAVVVATPVPTHYPLAKAALEAGKHVFVEKPPAMRVAEMEELIGLAEARGLVLMPGHLLLYHPGVQKMKELVDAGELGEVLVVYGNRQNLGKIRKDENALWSLGVHDLSVILYLIQEEIVEAAAHGHAFLNEGVEDVVFCYLRFGSGKIAHMHLSWLDPHKMRRFTVVGRDKMAVFDDMDLDRKITVYDKAPEQPSDTYGEWRTRTGDIFSPKVSNAEPLRLECQHFLRLVEEGWDGREMRDGLEVVRALELLTESLRG